ncbi:Phosphofurin acidic cluster sorting protein 1 [Trinorchestia longiramus]|nr:Phosphofurin acidic cluster sorting protein 1 [Trinorchestia longiramus]
MLTSEWTLDVTPVTCSAAVVCDHFDSKVAKEGQFSQALCPSPSSFKGPPVSGNLGSQYNSQFYLASYDSGASKSRHNVDQVKSPADKYLPMGGGLRYPIASAVESAKPRHIRQRSLGDSKQISVCPRTSSQQPLCGLLHQHSLQDDIPPLEGGVESSASKLQTSVPFVVKPNKYLNIPSPVDSHCSVHRSPRRSLGSVWRASSSSPARQLGAWIQGRRSKLNVGCANAKELPENKSECEPDAFFAASRGDTSLIAGCEDSAGQLLETTVEIPERRRSKTLNKRSLLRGSKDDVPVRTSKETCTRLNVKDIKMRGERFHFRGADRREVKSWCDERIARLIHGLQNTKSEDTSLLTRSAKTSKNNLRSPESAENSGKLLELDCNHSESCLETCDLSESNLESQFNERYLLGYCNVTDNDDLNSNDRQSIEDISFEFCESNTVKRRPNPPISEKVNLNSTSASPTPSLGSSSSEASPSDINISNSDNVNNNEDSTDLLYSERPTPSGISSLSHSTSMSCGDPASSPPDLNLASKKLAGSGLTDLDISERVSSTDGPELKIPNSWDLPLKERLRFFQASLPDRVVSENLPPVCAFPNHPMSPARPIVFDTLCSEAIPVGKGRSPRLKLNSKSGRKHVSSACVTRLCNVTITHLVLLSPPTSDLSSVLLAVKMLSSKRTLRSNEMPLSSNGALDTDLQLCYSLQYPHFLKRDGNSLQILLQRRKRYKNRTILGFKTLAVGLVNMAQVLQRPMDRELDLYGQGKEKGQPVARVTLEALSSQPVECDDSADSRLVKNFLSDNPDRSVELAEDSDDDPDYSSQDDGSDSEPMLDDAQPHHRRRQTARTGNLPANARQRNLKQRFVALLKKIKVPEALQAYETDPDLDPRTDVPVDPDDIEYLMNELEDLSDSGPEVDTLSISSTPKPSLRPYFSSSRSLLLEEPPTEKPALEHMSDESSKRDSDHPDTHTDAEHSDSQAGTDYAGGGGLVDAGGGVGPPDGGGASSSPPTAHKMSSPENTGNNNSSSGGKATSNSNSSSGADKGVGGGIDRNIGGPDKSAERLSSKSSHRSSKSVGGGSSNVFASVVSVSGGRNDKRALSTSSASSTPGASGIAHRQDSLHAQEPACARKGLQELLNSLLPLDDCKLPPAIILMDTSPEGESSCSGYHSLAVALSNGGLPVVTTTAAADVRAVMQHILNKLQKFCNSNAKAPGPMKVVMVGSDKFVNSVLRPYVSDFSLRPPDFQNHIRFLIVPLGGVSSLAKYLGSVDSCYGASFVSECWRDARDRWDPQDVTEAANRITRYLSQGLHTLHLPIAEAMLTYKDKGNDNESSQTFIPFVTDVRLGSGDVTSTSIDLDDAAPVVSSVSSINPSSLASSSNNLVNLSSSPLPPTPASSGSGGAFSTIAVSSTTSSVASGGGSLNPSTSSSPGMGSVLSSSQGIPILGDKNSRESTVTPPSSPNINTFHLPTARTMSESEALDLQIDYWLQYRSDRKGDDKERDGSGSGKAARTDGGKCTLKTSFRTLQVARLAPLGIVLPQEPSRDAPISGLTFSYATKENKKRIRTSDFSVMRLGKKKERERESESRRDVVDGVTRVLASTKTHPVTVTIDSVEWPNVKFFQLSSQWQTQVKTFPVCLFNLQSSSFGGDKI